MQGLRVTKWIKGHFWVIVVDAFGASLLTGLLLGASGSAALQPALFVLLMLVPVSGLLIMLGHNQFGKATPKPQLQSAKTRTIFIAPRPSDQRA